MLSTPVPQRNPAVNRRLSPGRKKPSKTPDSANTMAVMPT